MNLSAPRKKKDSKKQWFIFPWWAPCFWGCVSGVVFRCCVFSSFWSTFWLHEKESKKQWFLSPRQLSFLVFVKVFFVFVILLFVVIDFLAPREKESKKQWFLSPRTPCVFLLSFRSFFCFVFLRTQRNTQ